MSETSKTDPRTSHEVAQRFVQFIMVHAQNILFVLGKIPTPEGTLLHPNLQAGKMLIDQLEAIKIKTTGNLSPQEERILNGALKEAQMAFVEASGGTPASMMPDRSQNIDMNELEGELGGMPPEPEPAHPTPSPGPAPAKPAPTPAAQPAPAKPTSEQPTSPTTPPSPEENSKKKFFKSYG